MTYDASSMMADIKDLKRRVHQMEVSMRTGLASVGAFARQDSMAALVTGSVNVWSAFSATLPGPSVTVFTGEVAVIMMQGFVEILPPTTRFHEVRLSVSISGATNQPAGDPVVPLFGEPPYVTDEIFFRTNSASNLAIQTGLITGAWLQTGLTPGESTFELWGQYRSQAAGANKPLVGQRSILVLPLDV